MINKWCSIFLGVNFDFLRIEWVHKKLFIWRWSKRVAKWHKWFAFWTVFETIRRRKEVLLILLSEIDPYTLKIGDLSGDLAVLLLYRYHYYSIILYHIMLYQHFQWLSLLHLYSHGDIVVYLLYTTSFVMTLEEVKISYIKATVIILLDRWWNNSGGYFQIVRKVVHKGPRQAFYLAAADGGDDTSENDDGTWCYCQIAKDGSMNHVL